MSKYVFGSIHPVEPISERTSTANTFECAIFRIISSTSTVKYLYAGKNTNTAVNQGGGLCSGIVTSDGTQSSGILGVGLSCKPLAPAVPIPEGA